MRIKLQTTYDGSCDDWLKIYANGELITEGRRLTPYEIFFGLAERFPDEIELEPLIARGYLIEKDIAA